MKVLAFALIALSFTGMPLPAGAAIRESGGRRAPMAVQVEFTSRGQGIDSKAAAAVLEFIEEEKEADKVAIVKQTNRGREGEATICVEYKAINDVYAAELAILDLLEGSKGLTSVTRKLSCKDVDVILPHE